MGYETTTPSLNTYYAILITLIVMGLAGLLSVMLISQPLEFEQTETVAMDKYRSWVTGLGVGEGMEYTVTVDEGGPVDVFILYDTTHPPSLYPNNIAREYIGVMEASGTVELAGQEYYIMVDNTDEVGVDPSGTVVVTVSYASMEGSGRMSWTICSVLFVIIPLIIIIAIHRFNRLRKSMTSASSSPRYSVPSTQEAAAPPIERPKGLEPDRFTVLPEGCQVCGARLVLDSINNVALCPVCGTAGPPRL